MKDFRPICVHFVKETITGLRYECGDNDIELELSSRDKEIAINFLYFCNGKDSLEEIAKELKVKVTKLKPLIDILVEHKIIVDSRELYKFYHDAGSIPGPYKPNSGIDNVKSLRISPSVPFVGEGAITHHKMLKIVNGLSLSEEKYPLEFFVLLNHDYGELESGLYKLIDSKTRLVKLFKKFSTKLNKFLFTKNVVENSSAIVFVVTNYELSKTMYANREYRLCFLNSGRIVQNAFQLAEKEKVSLFECNEFNDNAISSFLNLKETQFCTTTLILGTSSENKNMEDKVDKLREFLTKKKFLRTIQVKTYQTDKYFMQKYATMAMSFKNNQNGKASTTCGVAETIIESELKCLVEMYERYTSGLLRVDKEITYNNQKNFFSIASLAPQNKRFLKKKKLKQINLGQKVKCVNAIGLLDTKKYLVPVDEVFYPYKEAMYYKANSSGVAAHYDKDQAIKNAFFELIERDAVLVTWYSKKSPSILDDSLLSEDIRQRVASLEKNNIKVNFLDVTKDSCVVILCLIHNQKYPKTSVGCSANFDIDKAIEKSLDEAELMLNTWNKESEVNRLVVKQDVETVIDHGNIFARVNLKNSEYKWIIEGEIIKQITPQITELNDLIKKFEPKVVDINKKKDLGLHVVRVMSDKLLPLTFGYGSEHYGHARLKELNLNWGREYPSLPHFIP